MNANALSNYLSSPTPCTVCHFVGSLVHSTGVGIVSDKAWLWCLLHLLKVGV